MVFILENLKSPAFIKTTAGRQIKDKLEAQIIEQLRLEPLMVDELAAAFDQLAVRWVVLSGGEAMQHPEWPAIARRLRGADRQIMLLTNGLLLRKQIDDVLATIDEVVVSMDAGTAPTYDAIRGVDAFDLVLDGIRAVRAGGVPVTTRTTVQRANYREIPQIIDACKAADVNHISFLTVDVSNPFAFGPRFEQNGAVIPAADIALGAPAEHGPPAAALMAADIDELGVILDEVEQRYAADFASGRMSESPEKLRGMLTYFGAVNGTDAFDGPRCNAPRISAVIEVDGTLRPCYFLPAWGKLRRGRSLAESLNDAEAVALRQAQRRGERHECARCVCPLYKGPRTLLRL